MKVPGDRALSNHDILKYIKLLEIPYFRGVFMRNKLPKKPRKVECLILNHDEAQSTGTHWTAMVKINNTAWYFDSFGRLPPPIELTVYLGKKVKILYNYNRYQDFNSNIYGQLSIEFLLNFWKSVTSEHL